MIATLSEEEKSVQDFGSQGEEDIESREVYL